MSLKAVDGNSNVTFILKSKRIFFNFTKNFHKNKGNLKKNAN